MKKNLIMKLASVMAVALVSVFVFSSCTTKKYYETGLDVDVIYRSVAKDQFQWDGKLGRFYRTFPYEHLDMYQLEELEVAGTVLFGKDADTDFCPLPYVNSYYDGNTHVVENVGFEVRFREVTFFIQTNNKDITYSQMIPEYEFKLTMFYWR